MKLKKTKKVKGQRGKGFGTHGSGARKNKRKSGNKGGIGMSGSGKRADHKKTLVTKLYGNKYFGKQGITSRGTKRDTRKRINLRDIQNNLEKFGKENKGTWIIELKDFKILGTGEVKNKLMITCLEASESAIEKVKKAGGEITVKEIKKIETPVVENPKHAKKKK
ncbi:MAG: uL15 family ribosomal protein [Nanoarchaeota archaeon]|nr:uL15 family ribosomal protein [Nanoarchaeota archaeon]